MSFRIRLPGTMRLATGMRSMMNRKASSRSWNAWPCNCLLVEELGRGRTHETGEADAALRVVWHQLASEQHHGGPQQASIHPQVSACRVHPSDQTATFPAVCGRAPPARFGRSPPSPGLRANSLRPPGSPNVAWRRCVGAARDILRGTSIAPLANTPVDVGDDAHFPAPPFRRRADGRFVRFMADFVSGVGDGRFVRFLSGLAWMT